MRPVTPIVGGLTAAALAIAAGAASAQEADPSARYDIDDALHRRPHDVSELPSVEEARGRPITVDTSLRGTFSTNAGAARWDPVDTGYATPAIGLSVTPVPLAGWSVGGGAMLDADVYTDNYDDDLGGGGWRGLPSPNVRSPGERSRPRSSISRPTPTTFRTASSTCRSPT